MRERPILFSGPMVRAILEGRKTQTRRIVNRLTGMGSVTRFERSDTPGYDYTFRDKRERWNDLSYSQVLSRCPYGKDGDVLWVRETHCKDGSGYIYRTDYGNFTPISDGIGGPWKPSIHMPRAACRLLLEITDIRIERLQEITAADAMAEGVNCPPPYLGVGYDNAPIDNDEYLCFHPVDAFCELWQSINGEKSWAENPWVWVVEFERIANE